MTPSAKKNSETWSKAQVKAGLRVRKVCRTDYAEIRHFTFQSCTPPSALHSYDTGEKRS